MDIALAERSDVAECAAVLAAAFADDPIMCTLWPDTDWRRRALPDYFTTSILHHHLAGGAVGIVRAAGRIVAVADWDPPGREGQSFVDTMRAAPSLLGVLRHRLPAAMGVRRRLDSHAPPKPYWYLAHIGSHPSVRGSGYANALMEQRMRHVRMGDAPAYLVCTRPETSPFYERFGFAVLDTFALADGGPLVQGMWCRPEE